MEDEALVTSFEAGAAPPDGFHHREHVRVAWWYLHQYALTEALARFSAVLRQFAAVNGKPDLYHETITTAYVLLINERLDGPARTLTWDAFVGRNPDLLSWNPSVLDRYYHPATLKSERARRTFVLPDRLAAG